MIYSFQEFEKYDKLILNDNDLNQIILEAKSQRYINFLLTNRSKYDIYSPTTYFDKLIGDYISDTDYYTSSEPKDKTHIKKWQIIKGNISKLTKEYQIIILIPDINDNIKNIQNIFDKFGYINVNKINYLNPELYNKFLIPKYCYHSEWKTLIFEPKEQKDIKKKLKDKYLYHVSPIQNKENIIKNGLIPMSKNNIFNYDNRIYCFKDIGYNKIKEYTKELNKYSKYKSSIYTIYTIDYKNTDNKFYDDLSDIQNVSVYTKTIIPFNSIISTNDIIL